MDGYALYNTRQLPNAHSPSIPIQGRISSDRPRPVWCFLYSRTHSCRGSGRNLALIPACHWVRQSVGSGFAIDSVGLVASGHRELRHELGPSAQRCALHPDIGNRITTALLSDIRVGGRLIDRKQTSAGLLWVSLHEPNSNCSVDYQWIRITVLA